MECCCTVGLPQKQNRLVVLSTSTSILFKGIALAALYDKPLDYSIVKLESTISHKENVTVLNAYKT